jgi:hypothetical protein
MFQYGIGFNATSQQCYGRRKEKVSGFILDETLIRE